MGCLISTKGRYALRIMIDLAGNGQGSYVPLKEMAERQDISLKYLESIMPNLIKSGLVSASQGRGGGYALSRPAEEYSIGEILKAAEGDLIPVACLADGYVCPRADSCRTLPVWKKLDGIIGDYLDRVPLSELLTEEETI